MARKLIIVIVVIGFTGSLFVYVPKANATAVWAFITSVNTGISAGANVAQTTKEFVLDPIARAIARGLINAAVNGIIKEVQTSGRDGGPTWILNWQNFLTEAQYRGEGEFRAILSKTNLCDYFAKDIKGLFNVTKVITLLKNTRTGNLDPYALRANCTMPLNFNLTNYQNDFAGNGGWNAWSRMLEPQNNYYGTLFGALDETSRQRAMEQTVDSSQALANNGFIGKSGDGANDSCQTFDANGKCLAYKNIQTPGKIFGDSVSSTIDNDLGWLVSSDEIGEIIIALGSAITNRMINLALDNPSNDYNNAPKADTSASDGYLACINTCPKADNLTCQNNCAKAFPNGGYNVAEPSSTPPPRPTPTPDSPERQPCTAGGHNEQIFMLPLLNGGFTPQDVVFQTNTQFGLTRQNRNEAVYYPENNTIGLPEFYLAGPTAGRPISPGTGLPWDANPVCP